MKARGKTLAILMAVLLLILSPGLVYADESGDSSTESEEFQYLNLFHYKLVDDELHITRAVDDPHYDEEGNIAFNDRCMITSLTIPETLPVDGVSYPVEYIDGSIWDGTGAFMDCFNLSYVKLPSTLRSIGDKAFSGCTSLTSVTLPDGLEYLGSSAFNSCTSLKSVNIPRGCRTHEYAGEQAYPGPFANTPALTSVTLEDGRETIGNGFFEYSGITQITIPDSVTSLGSWAFYGTENLETVNLSENSQLESIGWKAFSGSGLKSFFMPDTVSFVDVGAFAGCGRLETVRLSAAMTCNQYQTERGYDTGVFNGCDSLTNIIFPAGLTRIGRCWFFDSPIETMTIPATVTEIEDSAFRYCLNLEEVLFEDGCSLETIGSCAFRKDGALEEFDFPETIKTIGTQAFENCGLTSVVLPDSLETLHAGAFNGCGSLASVTIPANMTYDWGYNNGAFEGSNALKTVVFKPGVTKVDAGLFGWNEGLESIEIPEGVTAIGARAFRRAYSLKTIVLPQSLTQIDGEAFSDCTSLETMTFRGGRPTVESSICANVVATVYFGAWDEVPDNWGGDLTFVGEIPGVVDSSTLDVPESNRGSYVRPGNLTRARTSTSPRFPETWGSEWGGRWSRAMSDFRDLNEGYVGGMVIPGLSCTDVDGEECADMVPQGACQMGTYTLVSAYCKEASKSKGASGHQSVIYVLEGGRWKATLVLRGVRKGCHVGALAYSAVNDVVFIADSTTTDGAQHVRTLGGSVVREAVAADAYSALVEVGVGYAVGTNPSFLALGPEGGTLFVGDIGHDDDDLNWDRYFDSHMVGYQISEGELVDVTGRIGLPPRAQGVAFADARGTTQLVCSCSYGRTNRSSLYFAQLRGGSSSGFAVNGWRRVELPNMTEDLIPPSSLGGSLLGVLYESASTTYCPISTAEAALRRGLFPTDRMTALGAGILANAARADGRVVTQGLTTMADSTPDVVASGACGADAGWTLYDDGVLDVSGQGRMDDYGSAADAPWAALAGSIEKVYVGAAITHVGSRAFAELPALREVHVSDLVDANVFKVGEGAFAGDFALEVLSLPGAHALGEGWLPSDASELEVRTDSEDVAAACEGLAETHVHDFEQVGEVAATCGTDGCVVLHCSCGEEREGDVVPATGEHSYTEVGRVEPTTQEDGWVRWECQACGMVTVEDLPATGEDISTCDVSEIPDQPFTGSAVEPSVAVSLGGTALVAGTDYAVSYENNVEEGVATAVVSGVGSYCGTRAITFHIVDSVEPFFLDADPADDRNHGAEVDWMGRMGISTGWEVSGGREYRGMKNVTRCDFAAFLYRMADLSDDGARNDSIRLSDAEVRDVLAGVSDCAPEKTYHAMEVAWMIDSGISRGWPDKGKDTVSFRPMANVARQDMAAFLYRFADLADDGEQDQSLAMGPETVTFRDVKHGDTANHADEVEWLASVGVTKGWPVGGAYEFRGTRTVARQDMAAFMYRLHAYLNQ